MVFEPSHFAAQLSADNWTQLLGSKDPEQEVRAKK
jgi:hypothetical protein